MWVYIRWLRYNNFQKTEIFKSINAGFILIAPTTHHIFICFSFFVSVSLAFTYRGERVHDWIEQRRELFATMLALRLYHVDTVRRVL